MHTPHPFQLPCALLGRYMAVLSQKCIRRAGSLKIVFAATLVFIALPVAPLWAKEVQESRYELVELVLNAMQSNYSMIDAAKLSIQETVSDRSVDKETEGVIRLNAGGEVRWVRSPEKSSLLEVSISNHNVRCDRHEGELPKGKCIEIQSLLNGTWTHFVPGAGSAWIRTGRDLPSQYPVDPRQYATDDIRRSLEAVFAEDTIVSTQMKRGTRGQTISIVTRSNSGATMHYDFSSAAKFLPTRFFTLWEDGSLLQLAEVQYQPVLDNKALILKSLTRRFFDKGKAQFSNTGDWRQQMVREVVGPVRCSGPIDDSLFVVDLPKGTRVNDTTREAIYYKAASVVPRTSATVSANVVVVVFLAALVVIKTFRTKFQSTPNERPLQ